MSEENKKTSRTISRREFLRDAGIVVGGTAVSSAFFLSACGKEVEVTKTVTTTAAGSTVTTTAPGTTSTVTKTAAGSTQAVTKYICPVCSQEFDSLESLKAHYDSVHESQGEATKENMITLSINGKDHIVRIEPHWSLHYVLHQILGFISVKEMCTGTGACGSCSVIMDGRPILSCLALAKECDGKTIETAEGIANAKHPLVEAYIKHHCMQCGYCTPGFLVTAKALLDRNSKPSEADIRDILAGNICRCGTYPQHILAIEEVIK